MQLSVGAQKDKRVLVLFLLGSLALCSPLVTSFLPSKFTPSNTYMYNGKELIVAWEQNPTDKFNEIVPHNTLESNVELSPQLSILFNKPFPINRASKEDLQLLPGVGPSLAAKIHTYRLHHGNFSSIKQLMMVPGIGTKKAQTLQPLLSLSL